MSPARRVVTTRKRRLKLQSLSSGTRTMLQSHIIDIDGRFVGAAVRLDSGYRFVATDMRLEDLDSTIWPTLADVQRLARRLYLNGRFGERGPRAA
jgi:hypothetical protein